MLYYEQIERVKKYLLAMKEDLLAELNDLPQGFLCIYDSHGYTNYSKRFPRGGNRKKERRRGVKKDKERLDGLVRKEYITSALPIIDKDIQAIDTLLAEYIPVDENSVMEEFTKKYPELSGSIYSHPSSGEALPEQFSNFYEDSLKSTAADGTKRRSLGELIIGSRLNHYNIPFQYEAPFDHPDLKGRFSPDFTIRRPADGKIIYWEHLGDVKSESYMDYNRYKFSVYERYGIVPWNNLIISYSQPDFGINEKLIDALIQGWLL